MKVLAADQMYRLEQMEEERLLQHTPLWDDKRVKVQLFINEIIEEVKRSNNE